MKREESGKVLLIVGIFLLIMAASPEFVYFAVLVASMFFFYFLYQSRKNFRSDIILVFSLFAYFFALIFLVFFLGALSKVPSIYLGAGGVVLILAGAYYAGYLEKLKEA
ncbi:MAG: hypothetical protein JSV92_00300 [archaeon]|nr:MAG: hypothetical protein JSV92_00300 [archaeon]